MTLLNQKQWLEGLGALIMPRRISSSVTKNEKKKWLEFPYRFFYCHHFKLRGIHKSLGNLLQIPYLSQFFKSSWDFP